MRLQCCLDSSISFKRYLIVLYCLLILFVKLCPFTLCSMNLERLNIYLMVYFAVQCNATRFSTCVFSRKEEIEDCVTTVIVVSELIM